MGKVTTFGDVCLLEISEILSKDILTSICPVATLVGISSSSFIIPSRGTERNISGINNTSPSGNGDINSIKLEDGLFGGRKDNAEGACLSVK